MSESSFKNVLDAQKAHIKTLRAAIVILAAVCVAMFWGWKSAPNKLTIHVPPDLRSGSTRLWWDIPPEDVYSYGFYIFQQINRWPKDGNTDAMANLSRLRYLMTASCRKELTAEFQKRINAGELRNRVRGVYEIPGHGYADNPRMRVKQLSNNAWQVTLDIAADEYYETADTVQQVKRALVRYPIRVVRDDVDPEKNPWGLAFDCYTAAPQRIEVQGEKAPDEAGN